MRIRIALFAVAAFSLDAPWQPLLSKGSRLLQTH